LTTISETVISVSDLKDALPAVPLANTTVSANTILRQLLPELKIIAHQQPVVASPNTSLPNSGSVERNSNVHPPTPPTPRRVIGTPRKNKKKWYAVVVGRRTGIFEDWYYTPSLRHIMSYAILLGST